MRRNSLWKYLFKNSNTMMVCPVKGYLLIFDSENKQEIQKKKKN